MVYRVEGGEKKKKKTSGAGEGEKERKEGRGGRRLTCRFGFAQKSIRIGDCSTRVVGPFFVFFPEAAADRRVPSTIKQKGTTQLAYR